MLSRIRDELYRGNEIEALDFWGHLVSIVANEIHIGPNDTVLVQVADRRITANGKYHSTRRKIFPAPHLKASVGYFGLAQRNSNDFFSSWVPNAIRGGSTLRPLADFASYFLSELNKSVSKDLLRQHPSGFHICGFAEDGFPEFHFIRNIEGMNGPLYQGFRDHYFHTEEFRSRDFKSMTQSGNEAFVYVNGDVRSFWTFWVSAGLFVTTGAEDLSFSRPSSLAERARWKLEMLASFYRTFAKEKIVGGPIDVIEIRP